MGVILCRLFLWERIKDQGLRIKDQGLRIKDQGSRIKGFDCNKDLLKRIYNIIGKIENMEYFYLRSGGERIFERIVRYLENI